MKECLFNLIETIKNFEFSDCNILIIICLYLVFCFLFISKTNFKSLGKNKLKYIFIFLTFFVVYIVLFKVNSSEGNNYLEKINIIATIALTFVALQISLAQNRMANFEFSEKIGFPNLKGSYDLKKTDSNDIENYTKCKKFFNNPSEDNTVIYEFVFELNNQLNPQIFYFLKAVNIYDSIVSPQQIKNRKNLNGEEHTQVSFKIDLLSKSTIHIYLDDTKRHFLPVLLNPESFSNENCNELSVVFKFLITDLINSAFDNKELFLLVHFNKTNSNGSFVYEITSVQTFVDK